MNALVPVTSKEQRCVLSTLISLNNSKAQAINYILSFYQNGFDFTVLVCSH